MNPARGVSWYGRVRGLRRAFLLIGWAGLLAGCAASLPAPVTNSMGIRPLHLGEPAYEAAGGRVYVVKAGDTLYGIALDHGLDYKDLARWNGIGPGYMIRVGQRLRLGPQRRRGASGRAMPQKTAQGAAKTGASHRPSGPAQAPAEGADAALGWQWPAQGKIIGSFDAAQGHKGIDIAGTTGEPVYAAAAGYVVYCGDGLHGYGNLVIIKHNNAYLSAYAHNSKLLVAEGQRVARGQEIAEMGESGAQHVELHFEIRRFGQPVNPLDYLPKPPLALNQ